MYNGLLKASTQLQNRPDSTDQWRYDRFYSLSSGFFCLWWTSNRFYN